MEIKADVTDTNLRDLHNSSDDTKAELNNFFYCSFKVIPSLKVSKNMHRASPSKFIFDTACLGDKGSFSSVNILQIADASSCLLAVLGMFLANISPFSSS